MKWLWAFHNSKIKAWTKRGTLRCLDVCCVSSGGLGEPFREICCGIQLAKLALVAEEHRP